MMRLIVTIPLLFAGLPLDASSLTRLAGETTQSFAIRNAPPRAKLIRPLLESKAPGHASDSLVAFYESEIDRRGQSYRSIVGYLYVSRSRDVYRRLLIDTFEAEGGDPQIESLFFADAGGEKRSKLIIICSWPQVHYDFRGKLYATFVYEVPGTDSNASKLKIDHELSQKLEGGCECEWRDGTKTTAKFKTENEVKTALQALSP
ncbi:MAG: hypothetical protein L0Y39_06300 [Methylococcaceae bacterium]|nr:hypothetical protein [Methylococcaceae bacterium]MCI0667386.1 hypothetical protein [Methylococcaceae bacterium]